MRDHGRGYEPGLRRRHGTPSPGSDAALDENGLGMTCVLLQRAQSEVRGNQGAVEAVLLAVQAAVDVAVAGADEVEDFVAAACAGPECC